MSARHHAASRARRRLIGRRSRPGARHEGGSWAQAPDLRRLVKRPAGEGKHHRVSPPHASVQAPLGEGPERELHDASAGTSARDPEPQGDRVLHHGDRVMRAAHRHAHRRRARHRRQNGTVQIHRVARRPQSRHHRRSSPITPPPARRVECGAGSAPARHSTAAVGTSCQARAARRRTGRGAPARSRRGVRSRAARPPVDGPRSSRGSPPAAAAAAAPAGQAGPASSHSPWGIPSAPSPAGRAVRQATRRVIAPPRRSGGRHSDGSATPDPPSPPVRSGPGRDPAGIARRGSPRRPPPG